MLHQNTWSAMLASSSTRTTVSVRAGRCSRDAVLLDQFTIVSVLWAHDIFQAGNTPVKGFPSYVFIDMNSNRQSNYTRLHYVSQPARQA